MFSSKSNGEKVMIVNGMVMRVDLTATLLSMKKGEQKRFGRKILSEPRARVLCSRIKKLKKATFQVNSFENGEYIIVTRME